MNFAEVEREVAKLRQELAAGRLTEEQFKARLRELMVLDEHGAWWMVGYETGEWYRHDGTDWVRADPPGRAALEPAPSLTTPPPSVPSPPSPQAGARKASGLIVGSLIATFLGLFSIPLLGGIVGLILGYKARRQIRASGATITDKRLVTVSIVLGWIAIAWWTISLFQNMGLL